MIYNPETKQYECGHCGSLSYETYECDYRVDNVKRKQDMSAIIDFYLYNGTDSEGRTIEYILSQDLQWMEDVHNYIQWLFPLKEPSNFNPDAPILTDEDIKLFQTHINNGLEIANNLFRAVDKFLYFLGIVFVSNDIETSYQLANNFEQQKYTWLEFNHNALRITRFLKFLTLLGEGTQGDAKTLLTFMEEEAKKRKIVLHSLNYWRDAIKNEK